MTSAAYSAHPALAVAAEVTPYALGLLCVGLPVVAWKKKRAPMPALLWLCGLISLALIYVLRDANRNHGFGVGIGLHFSSHTAVVISFAVTLTACRFATLPALLPVLGGYFWLIVHLGYHAPGDVLSTAVAVLPLGLLCHLPWWRKLASGKR